MLSLCKILGFFVIPITCAVIFSYCCVQENVYEDVEDLPYNIFSILKVNIAQPFGFFTVYELINDKINYDKYMSGVTHPNLKLDRILVPNKKRKLGNPMNDRLKVRREVKLSNDFETTISRNPEKIITITLDGQEMEKYFDKTFPDIYNLDRRTSPFNWNKNYKLLFLPIIGEPLFVLGTINDDRFEYIAINNTYFMTLIHKVLINIPMVLNSMMVKASSLILSFCYKLLY